jgi:hypothetical protein
MNAEQPEPTEEEQEQAQTGRQQEEEEMRYPGHGNPDAAREENDDLPDGEEIHDA